MHIRPDVQAYFAAMQAQAGPSIIDMEPAMARRIARGGKALAELPARPMRRQNLAIGSRGAHRIQVRLFHPVAPAVAAPVLVFYHGGGWVLGDVDGYDPLCSEIAFQLGMTVVSVEYRLGPEHLFPAAVEDALDATLWAASGPAELGHAVSGLVVAGDSAGGTLAAVAARELADAPGVPVLAQWLIYPVTDLSRDYPSDTELAAVFGLTAASRDRFYGYYLGTGELAARKQHPHVSPMLAERWAGLAPAVLMTCSLDPLRDQGRAYAARLVQAGVTCVYYEASGQVHGSFTMRKMLPSAQDDLLRGVAALKLLLSA